MNNHQKEQQLEEQHLAQCLKIIQQNIHLYEDKESQYKKSPSVLPEGLLFALKKNLETQGFFKLRMMGLEPIRHGHTPLKRACLPVPAHSHSLLRRVASLSATDNIIAKGNGFVNIFCRICLIGSVLFILHGASQYKKEKVLNFFRNQYFLLVQLSNPNPNLFSDRPMRF